MPTHLILDTHIVLEWLLWDSPRHAELRAQFPVDTVVWRSAETADELHRVLGYAALKVTEDRQAQVLQSYLAQSQLHQVSAAENLPRCRDPDDQKFLELAWSLRHALDAGENHQVVLLSRDKRVLKIGRHRVFRSLFLTQTPEYLRTMSPSEILANFSPPRATITF
jgi:uncharacterized protein